MADAATVVLLEARGRLETAVRAYDRTPCNRRWEEVRQVLAELDTLTVDRPALDSAIP